MKQIGKWTRLGIAALCLGVSLLAASPAEAARCTKDAAGLWSCTHKTRVNWYFCNGIPMGRNVRWEVPEGTAPSGGWPVAFFYNGTTPADTNPFIPNLLLGFGAHYSPQIMHELLDDPAGTGKKYAVVALEPPQGGVIVEFWNTNSVFPYSASCDYDLFPDFFAEIKSGNYGSGLNMNKRYAYGISSGGYNTSRMAVTFNAAPEWWQSAKEWGNQNTWKALAVISASYATCTGPACTFIPALPTNHPATKFWHGTLDIIVPKFTAELYYNALAAAGIPAFFHTHGGGHELNATMIGSTGVKAFFDSRN